jgi:hypothetical protein
MNDEIVWVFFGLIILYAKRICGILLSAVAYINVP